MNEPTPNPTPDPDPIHQPQPDPRLPIVITTANKASDIAQIIYGLSIRGVRSISIHNPEKQGDRYQIIHEAIAPSPIQIRIAQESIEGIWDAILEEYHRAVTDCGHCHFCQYDVTQLPKPTICPECGINLDSIKARRAMRDRKKPESPD